MFLTGVLCTVCGAQVYLVAYVTIVETSLPKLRSTVICTTFSDIYVEIPQYTLSIKQSYSQSIRLRYNHKIQVIATSSFVVDIQVN